MLYFYVLLITLCHGELDVKFNMRDSIYISDDNCADYFKISYYYLPFTYDNTFINYNMIVRTSILDIKINMDDKTAYFHEECAELKQKKYTPHNVIHKEKNNEIKTEYNTYKSLYYPTDLQDYHIDNDQKKIDISINYTLTTTVYTLTNMTIPRLHDLILSVTPYAPIGCLSNIYQLKIFNNIVINEISL